MIKLDESKTYFTNFVQWQYQAIEQDPFMMGSNDRPPFSYNGCRLYSHYAIQTVLNGNNEITPTIPITINCDKLDVIASVAFVCAKVTGMVVSTSYHSYKDWLWSCQALIAKQLLYVDGPTTILCMG